MARGVLTPAPERPQATLHAFADAAQRVRHLAQTVRTRLHDALRERSDAVLAVSGGRSPAALLDELAQQPLDWARIVVTLVDERLVPPTHPDSNEALVRRHLLRGRAAAASFTGLVGGDAHDLQDCARRANAAARPADVVLLGMGDDGHVASLFADAVGVDPAADHALDPRCTQRYVALRPLAAPHARIGMSLAALRDAPNLLLSLSGAARLRTLEHALAAAMLRRAACAEAPDGRDSGPAIQRLLRHRPAGLEIWWTP